MAITIQHVSTILWAFVDIVRIKCYIGQKLLLAMFEGVDIEQLNEHMAK